MTINGAYRASPVRAGAGPSGSSPETPLDERGQDVTADQNGSLAGYGADTVALELQGGGTVQLGNVNTYSGGTTIDGATLELLAASTTPVLIPAGTAGSGAITFAPGVAGTLKIDSTGLPTNPIAGFSFSDAIDLAGVATSFTGATVDADNRLTVAPGETLQMAASDNFGGDVFQFSPDGSGGTRVTLERLPPAKQIVAGGIWDETSVWQLGIPAVSHDNVRFMNGDLAVNLTAVGGGNVFGASYPASFAKPLQIETLEFAGSGDVVNVAGSSTFEGGVGLKTGIVGGGDAATIEIGANAKLWINGDIVQSTNGIAIIEAARSSSLPRRLGPMAMTASARSATTTSLAAWCCFRRSMQTSASNWSTLSAAITSGWRIAMAILLQSQMCRWPLVCCKSLQAAMSMI